MKQIARDSIGYRIREARKSVGMNQKDFAARLGVTSNYMGMIERGDDEKKPSVNLIGKIAQLTGKSVEWLLYGSNEISIVERSSVPEIPEINDIEEYGRYIDLRLLFSLLCIYQPDMTTDRLSSVLRITKEDLESIIRGEGYIYNSSWKAVLPALIKQLDIPSLYRKLGVLDAIRMTWVENEYCNIALHAMENFVVDAWSGAIAATIDEKYAYSSASSNTRIIKKIFQNQIQPYSIWECIFIINSFRNVDNATELIKTTLSTTKAYREEDRVSFSFADSYKYDLYKDIISAVLATAEEMRFRVSIMYVDPETRGICAMHDFSDAVTV